MKSKLKINVSKAPVTDGLITCRTLSARERFMRFLFGGKCRVMVLIPGDGVGEITISDADPDKEGKEDAKL